MATPSTFSYAQAAKGQGATSITSPPNPSAQAQAPQPASSATKMPNGSADSPDSCSADVCSTLEKQDVGSSDGSENDTHFEAASEHTPDIKRVDVATRLERPWRRTDTGSKSSTVAVPSVDECEPRKPHKASKSKGSSTQAIDLPLGTDQEQEAVREVPKLELSEAPIPTVNIWKKRQEAQLAKTKPILIRNEELANGGPGQSKDTKTLARSGPEPSSPLRHNSSINGARPTHKASDVARSERNGPRGSRADERDVKGVDAELPPSVEDATAWPTPETAILEDKKKLGFSGADRQEKEHKESQDEGTQPKSRQKGRWVTYDYVPTASFDTQLPPMRNSRPRGGARAINGTRIVPGTVGGDGKSTPATQTGRPGDSIRERSLEATTTTNGTASAAPTAKRASIDACFSKDQKRAVGLASVDKFKPISQAPEQAHGKQDRLEGRGERGRGGYRGRGGHHSISNHSQHQQNTSSGYATGPMSSRPQGPYSPPSRQGGHNQMAMGHQQRGGRGRNGAGTNIHRMSLPNGSTRLAPVQTQFSPYEQQPMAPLSAMPYPSQLGWENVVPSLVKHQIEYYFSIDNLCKDMYLRQRMDSQGFVNLHFVAAFKRIRQLTSDINTIRAACEWSTEIDFVTGEDDVERVRRRVKWQDFVLPVEKRDLFARNSGPAQITFKNRPSGYGTPFGGIPQFGVSLSLGYNLHNEALFPSFANGYAVNGAVSDGGSRHGGASQLSADVPDFSPLGSAMTSNGMVESIVASSGEVDKQNEAKVNGHGNETIAEEMPTENDSNRPQS